MHTDMHETQSINRQPVDMLVTGWQYWHIQLKWTDRYNAYRETYTKTHSISEQTALYTETGSQTHTINDCRCTITVKTH